MSSNPAALSLVPSHADVAVAVRAARALSDDLAAAFVERGPVIRALLLALVAREHVCLLGDPGTGKSAITNALTGAIGGRSFVRLMTKYTVPEEVFGPISLAGLESDHYRRVTAGYLPAVEVAFLDEVFKANSAILNSLLTVMNERAHDDDGARHPVPLEILVGASNELPADESLGAMWDRFLLRLWVDPIRNRDALRGLLASRKEPRITATLHPDLLAILRAAAEAVVIPDDVLDLVLDVRDALAQEHGITASDRRWRKCMKLVAAAATLAGRARAEREDVLVLADALWSKPEEAAKIRGTLARLVSPDLAAALRISDAATELRGNLGDLAKANMGQITTAVDELGKMIVELQRLQGVGEITASVVELRKAIGREIRVRVGG